VDRSFREFGVTGREGKKNSKFLGIAESFPIADVTMDEKLMRNDQLGQFSAFQHF